tara:strand:- start:125 stop:397 length:273 start_codon:yes stop_codon:yes gene_type:complete
MAKAKAKTTDYNVKKSPMDLLSIFLLFDERGIGSMELNELDVMFKKEFTDKELERPGWIYKTIKVGIESGCKTVADLVNGIEQAYQVEFS